MKNRIKYFVFLLFGASALASCSDAFLEEKQNYDATGQDVYNYYVGAKGRINDLYGWCLPNVNNLEETMQQVDQQRNIQDSLSS